MTLNSIHACRGIVKQRRPLAGRVVSRDAFEPVPKIDVTIRKLLHREIALQHAALGAESIDAVLKIGLQHLG